MGNKAGEKTFGARGWTRTVRPHRGHALLLEESRRRGGGAEGSRGTPCLRPSPTRRFSRRRIYLLVPLRDGDKSPRSVIVKKNHPSRPSLPNTLFWEGTATTPRFHLVHAYSASLHQRDTTSLLRDCGTYNYAIAAYRSTAVIWPQMSAVRL